MLLILLVQNRLYQNFHKRRRTREDRRKGYHSSKRTKEQAHHHQVTLLLFVKGFTILLFFVITYISAKPLLVRMWAIEQNYLRIKTSYPVHSDIRMRFTYRLKAGLR